MCREWKNGGVRRLPTSGEAGGVDEEGAGEGEGEGVVKWVDEGWSVSLAGVLLAVHIPVALWYW